MARLTDYRDRVAIVTGASSGIGAQLARDLAARGMRTALLARRADRLEALAAEIGRAGGTAWAVTCDVAERGSVEAAVRAVLDRCGRVDLLVNSAGYGRHVLFKDHDVEDIERMMRTNYMGTVWAIKAVLPAMRLRGAGWIVNISSVAGKIGQPDEAAYSATKFAVAGLSEGLAIELGTARHPRDVRASRARAHGDVHARDPRAHARPRHAYLHRAAGVHARRAARPRAREVRGDGSVVHRHRVPRPRAAARRLPPADGEAPPAGPARPGNVSIAAAPAARVRRGAMLRVLTAVLIAAAVGSAGAQGLPDLRLDTGLLGSSVTYDVQVFDPADPAACELKVPDLCVGGPGVRKLLRFSVFAINQGDADLVVGTPDPNELLPDGSPKWVYSACHKHFHFQTFARYELRPRGGTSPVLLGQKRSFCVEDTKKADAAAPDAKRYGCNPAGLNTQGVQVGWGDLYPSNLACQWIDITDLAAAGDYDLCVFINTAGLLPDADPANDQGCVPVTIAAPAPGSPAPKVTVLAPHARKKVRVGKRLKIAWKKKVKGGDLRFVEAYVSTDDGATWRFAGATNSASATR